MKLRYPWVLASAALIAGDIAAAETVERIVAKVNGQIITLSQLEQEVRTTLERLGPAPTTEEEQARMEQVRPETLNRMIDNMLVLQVAEERGLRVPARFFEEWKKGVMEQMKLTSEEEFVRQVELQGASVDVIRKQFEESLLLQEVRRMEVDSKVSVSEPEIGERYREHIADYTEAAKVRLREIVVKFDSITEVDQGQKARRLLQEIRQGADFAEVARMHSESSSREAGGDLGFFEKGELTDALEKAAFALAPGEVSEVLRMETAYYILRVEEKVEEKVKTLEEVRSEVADAIFQEKMNAQLERYIQQLRERAIVEINL
jgi:peptidyl-prolyl cis-trans isomerase SurA